MLTAAVKEVRRTTTAHSSSSVFHELRKSVAWKELTIDQVRRAVSACNAAEQGASAFNMSKAASERAWASSIVLSHAAADYSAGVPTGSGSHPGLAIEKVSPCVVGANMNNYNTNGDMSSSGGMLDCMTSSRGMPDCKSHSECWGAQLTGTSKNCSSHFVAGTKNFKSKFCARCSRGITVLASQVRALLPDGDLPGGQAVFKNRKSSGCWKSSPQGFSYRILNNTSECVGPKLVVFHSTPPQEFTFPPLPVLHSRTCSCQHECRPGALGSH
jgi:hypothetical protein